MSVINRVLVLKHIRCSLGFSAEWFLSYKLYFVIIILPLHVMTNCGAIIYVPLLLYEPANSKKASIKTKVVGSYIWLISWWDYGAALKIVTRWCDHVTFIAEYYGCGILHVGLCPVASCCFSCPGTSAWHCLWIVSNDNSIFLNYVTCKSFIIIYGWVIVLTWCFNPP